MTQQAELFKKIDKLPPQFLGEVNDFISYLQYKAQNNKGEHTTYKTSHETREWCNPLLGLAKAKGATLTLDRFMEMQQEEIALEIANDQRLFGNSQGKK